MLRSMQPHANVTIEHACRVPATLMVNLSRSLGAFLMFSQKGRLVALERIEANETLDQFRPRPSTVSLDGLEPLFVRMRPSPMTLVIHPGHPPTSYFLTVVPTGDRARCVKVFQTSEEIVKESIHAGLWPVIDVGELQRAALAVRDNATTLSVPVRRAELRENLPEEWREELRGVFLANLEQPSDKNSLLEDHVIRLRHAISHTMITGWLGNCLWLDPKSGLIGRALPNHDRTGFANLSSDELGLLEFRKALARDTEGRVLRTTGVANVLPTLRHGTDWSGPTVHVYDQAFRVGNRLDEYYSLHRGLRAISSAGAPLLEYSRGPLGLAVPVTLLTPAAAPETPQALAVRRFPLRHLVWRTRNPLPAR